MSEKVLVTGGGGFLGSVVVKMLLERGDKVRIIGRNEYPELQKLGSECFKGDIRSFKDTDKACQNIDVVQHIAALPGIWGKKEDFFSINVKGTENVIGACIKNNISRLIYTSSPSVIHSSIPISGKSESELEYPENYIAHYPHSKKIAEIAALKADNTILSNGEKLRTVSLRPHLIWGPGDKNLIPRLIEKAKTGRLKILGSGKNLVDIVYVDNAAEAQLIASDLLKINPEIIGGKSYFITQDKEVNLWDFMNKILEIANVSPVKTKIPFKIAYTAGGILELFHNIFLPHKEPMMTRFLAEQLAQDHYFSKRAAREELGYIPKITTEEGLKRLKIFLNKN